MRIRALKLCTIAPLLVLAVVLLCSWPGLSQEVERKRGEHDARTDIAHGKYELLGYGLVAPGHSEYAHLLTARYGITFRAVAGCIVTADLIAYVNSYNTVVEEAAKQRFGKDIFAEAHHDAEHNLKEQHP